MKFTTKHLAIIVFSTMGIFGIHYFYELKTIKKEGVYSIGIVTEYSHGRASACYYRFYYKGIEYNRGNVNDVFSPKDIGKRFFVQFLKDDPEKCVLLRKEVPVCISEAPPEGWEIIPHCMDEDGNLH